MRLGADPVKLHEGTRARETFGEAVIYKRHRHRFEVNNMLRRRLEDEGLVCSGTSPDERLVEIIELPDHPFFIASQFHPEFNSRPTGPSRCSATSSAQPPGSPAAGKRRRPRARWPRPSGWTPRTSASSAASWDHGSGGLCRGVDSPAWISTNTDRRSLATWERIVLQLATASGSSCASPPPPFASGCSSGSIPQPGQTDPRARGSGTGDTGFIAAESGWRRTAGLISTDFAPGMVEASRSVGRAARSRQRRAPGARRRADGPRGRRA